MRRLTAIVATVAAVAAVLLVLALTVPASGAEPITVQAAVETDRVYAGESFVYRVIVEGATPQVQPQLPALDAFEVMYEGDQDVSSHSISIINGRRTETVIEQYYFQYRLTALSPGQHTIPAATLTIDGQTYRTEPIAITVVQPTEHQDFKLRLALEKEQVYVGEPVRLQLTWYLRQSVQGFALSMPLSGAFAAGDPAAPADARQGLLSGEYVAVPFLGSEVLARRGQGTLNGEQFTTLTLEKVLIPQEVGQFRIGPAAVELNVVTGQAPSRSLLDDFFSGSSFFRNSPFNRETTRKLVVPSNELSLEVLPLPEPRPASFTGLVGAYSIETAAAPTEVNVGDPITLTIRIRGPEPLGNVPAPALHTQRSLIEDFKVSDAPTAPVVRDGSAVFTQTVRALNDRVTAIPPLDLSFFDVEAGEYRTVRSVPIPLVVRATREVTAADAVGGSGEAPAGTEVETRAEGIVHNYEDADVLTDQGGGLLDRLRHPAWLAALLGPMVIFLGLAAVHVARRRSGADTADRRRGQALREARRELRATHSDTSTEAARTSRAIHGYLAATFDVPVAGLTPAEAERLLRARGMPQAAAVRELLERCDAARFAGLEPDVAGGLCDEAEQLLDAIDRWLNDDRSEGV